MNDTLSSRIRTRMRALDDDGLLRTLRAPSGIDLSSNDYLGLANHPHVKERMIEAVAREGAGGILDCALLFAEVEVHLTIDVGSSLFVRSDHPNIHDVGFAIGRFSFKASTPLTLRTSDQTNHQNNTAIPMSTKVRIVPTTRYNSPIQNVRS